jgi:hypothetical protein
MSLLSGMGDDRDVDLLRGVIIRVAGWTAVAVVLTLVVAWLTGCGTHLSATSDSKMLFIERSAGFQLTDCAVDAGRCQASQIRALATSIQCAAVSVRADGRTGSADAGATCAQAGAAP